MNFQNTTNAIKSAVSIAPCGIGYRKGHGWFTYDLTHGCPVGCEPEFVVLAQGKPPIPLSEVAGEVWLSVVRAQAKIQAAARL